MPKFEVTPNDKHRFLSKLRLSLKSATLSSSADVQRRINGNWDFEKKLFDDIASSSNSAKDRQTIKELRYILHQIGSQVDDGKEISSKTASALMGLLVDRISSLLSSAQRKEQLTEHVEQYALFTGGSFLSVDEFSCQSCCELLYNPITLQCGHSFCHICVLHNSLRKCVVCRKSYQDNMDEYRINICLTKILQTWHSVEWFGRSLIVDGLQKLNKEEYQESVNMFSQALDMIPNSHVATLHRAKAYFLLNKLDHALEDSIKACILAQKWPETYFVKGEILFKLHCFEQSLLSLLICLVLDPHNAFAKDRIHEIISKLVGSVYEDLAGILHENANKAPSEKLSITSHKRHIATSESDSNSKPKVSRQELSTSITCTTTVTLDSVVTTSCSDTNSASLRLTQSDTDVFQGDEGAFPDAMRRSNTHVLLTFELSYNKSHDQNLFGNGSGMFPNVANELEKTLDSVLVDIDNDATGDLRALQNSFFDKELLEAVSLKFPPKPRSVDTVAVDASDLECSLCMRLFYEPVCTPCGHTFCQTCIERCLDHNARCPLCKHPMEDYLAGNMDKKEKKGPMCKHPTCDYVTKSIIQQYLPVDYKERINQHQTEMDELLERKPIFVCTIAFPSVPCPLHIFEPRYRLMLRRCLDHNDKEFGMCMPEKEDAHSPVGTLLKVRDVEYFSDGRSVVDSIGYRRFKTSNSQLQDGYNTAKISFIIDVTITNLQSVDMLSRRVYIEAQAWFKNLDNVVKSRITEHFGDFPTKDDNTQSENGPDWHWWVLAILPVEDRVKATVLGKNVLHERLLIIHRIFTCLQQRNKKRS